MAEKRYCSRCGEELEKFHFLDRCEKLELIRARNEIKALKQSISEWKESWLHLRQIIGNLWWWHPAIDNVNEQSYYQTAQQKVKEINGGV